MNRKSVTLPSNKKFGLFFVLVFAGCSLYYLSNESSLISYVFACLALALLVVTAVTPSALRPLNKLWMALGLLLGQIISPIMKIVQLSCPKFSKFLNVQNSQMSKILKCPNFSNTPISPILKFVQFIILSNS